MKIRYIIQIEIDVEPPAGCPSGAIREMLLNQSLGWLADPAVCSVCGSTKNTQLVHFHLGSDYGYQQMTSCQRCRPAVDAEAKIIKTQRL